jgi:topoisomerase-4 subunit B
MKSAFKANQKVEISRFKGLGEMPTAYLRATTMDPKNRVLLRITLPERTEIPSVDFKATLDLVESLMGRRPELRFNFIQENARFVRDLDV